MITILAMIVTGTLNIVCFFIGVNTVQKVKEDKMVELPTFNPLKVVREHHEHREFKKEQDKLETIMKNIEAYDGTSNHQEDVPR